QFELGRMAAEGAAKAAAQYGGALKTVVREALVMSAKLRLEWPEIHCHWLGCGGGCLIALEHHSRIGGMALMHGIGGQAQAMPVNRSGLGRHRHKKRKGEDAAHLPVPPHARSLNATAEAFVPP